MSAVADDLGAHEFRRHIKTEDPLGMVLRAHLFIERELTIIIEHLLPDPKPTRNWRYATRLDLVEAVEIFDHHMIQAYRPVGTLRNKAAHNLDQEIDEARQAEFLPWNPELWDRVGLRGLRSPERLCSRPVSLSSGGRAHGVPGGVRDRDP
jgi:hypothetical protein